MRFYCSNKRMLFQFDSAGVLVDTPYWISEEARQGRVWCSVREGVWHLLMPTPGRRFPDRWQPAHALPVRTSKQPEGWCWKLWITRDWWLLLPLSQFEGGAPPLPDPGARLERRLIVYGHWLPGLSQQVTWSFGNLPTHAVPQEYCTRLQVCRVSRRRFNP